MKGPSATLATAVAGIAALECFSDGGHCPTLLEPGDPKIVLISGGNASGKSLFARVLASTLRTEHAVKPEVMLIGMNLRREPGFARALIFGEDQTSSTGAVSVKTALAGVRNSRARENPHVLMLDEPDIGLAEGYQAALGQELAAYAASLPSSALGFLLISHSRDLMRPFLPLNPTSVRVGDDLRPISQWITEGDRPRSTDDLELLSKTAHDRFLAVNRLLKKR